MTACQSQKCPRFAKLEDEFDYATRNPPDDHHCIERWAEYVCTWTPEKHAERKRAAKEREPASDTAIVHVYEVHCGCIAQPYGDCFVELTGPERTGTHVYFISTGAPGCDDPEKTKEIRGPRWHSWPDGSSPDPAACGSTYWLRYRSMYDHEG
jgi:hypothetical protein